MGITKRVILTVKYLPSIILERLFRAMQKRYYGRIFVHGPRERLTLGNHISLANTLFNTMSGNISVGDEVIFGHNVLVLTGIHAYTRKSPNRRTVKDAGRDIIIGKGAWLASNVTVIGPVRIGEEAVVSAGSVVSSDVPDNTIVAGNPATIVKEIEFED